MPSTKEPLFETLRKHRKAHKYSVIQLAEILKNEHGIRVAPKTIYNWESDMSKPPIEVLLALMDIYSIPSLLDSFKNKPPLTANMSSRDNDDLVFIPKVVFGDEKLPWGKLKTHEEGQYFIEAVMRLPAVAKADIALMAEFIMLKNGHLE